MSKRDPDQPLTVLRATVGALVVLAIHTGLVEACVSTATPQMTGGTIAVFGIGMPTSTLSSAFGFWSSCPGYGTSQPSFQVGSPNQSYNFTVTAILNPGVSPVTGQCGNATFFSGGQSNINLWEQTRLPTGQVVSCAPYSETLAHELGHSLGLGNSSCAGYLMGPRNYNLQTGWTPRSPAQPSECNAVAGQWTTPPEHECP